MKPAEMRISGKVEQADLDDARKLLLGKWYRVRFLRHQVVQGAAFALAGVLVVSWLRHDWSYAVAVTVVSLVLLGLQFGGGRRSRERDLARLNDGLPGSITVLADGVQFDLDDGTVIFTPWAQYSAFQEGQRVIWLKTVDKQRVVMLPAAGLDRTARQMLGDRLASVLGRANS